MSGRGVFDTIWRKVFDPELVHVPRSQYQNYVPMVEVRPRAVYDPQVVYLDAALRRALSRFHGIVTQIIGTPISMPQLVAQIPSIVNRSTHVLRIFARGRMVKEVRVTPRLREVCANIQAVIQERLLLFEDMVGTLTAEEIDSWGENDRARFQSSTHVFRPGAKLDAVLELGEQMPRMRLAVFVRNVAVCEALTDALLAHGVAATFVHGQLPGGYGDRIAQFRQGKATVLVATRQLFGRGFDLPQAQAAIFYSPKRSVHTMWQEMLRIRGTVRDPKVVFVLFYAWTAEETKTSMFLRDMLATGARQTTAGFRWRYAEEEEEEGEAIDLDARNEDTFTDDEDDHAHEEFVDDAHQARPAAPADAPAATKEFVSRLVKRMTSFRKEQTDSIAASLQQMAEDAGFSRAWPVDLVATFLSALASTLRKLITDNRLTIKACRNELAQLVHPDKHTQVEGTEKKFWHELTVNLNVLT